MTRRCMILMIYHTYIPRSPLSQFVAFLWSSEGDGLPQAQVRLLPVSSMELVIKLGDRFSKTYVR